MGGSDEFEQALRHLVEERKTSAGEKFYSLGLTGIGKLARRFEKSIKQIEIAALRHGVMPERYRRNMGTIGMEGQLELLLSEVAVIGLGGLGGLVSELLARMGVGSLILVDGDKFTASNLNRQIGSTESNLGMNKALVAQHRIGQINSAVEVRAIPDYAGKSGLVELLEHVHLAMDCLDNLPARFDLESACQERNIPMVHAAVDGCMGQLAVIWPGTPLLSSIYGNFHREGVRSGKGSVPEVQPGNPAATPALIASWEVNEAVKILLGGKGVLCDELLYLDLLNNEVDRIPLK